MLLAKKPYATCKNGMKIYYDRKDKRGGALFESNGNVNPKSLILWQLALNVDEWKYVIDIGSNYGEMILLPQLPHSAKVIAFEPNPNVFNYLKKSLKQVKFKYELHRVALTRNSQKRVIMAVDLEWSGTSGLLKDGKAPRSIEGRKHKNIKVKSGTLDDFFKVKPKDFAMKIDVEGLEFDVLSGAVSTFESAENWIIMLEILHENDFASIYKLLPKSFLYALDYKNLKLTPVSIETLNNPSDERKQILKKLSIYEQDIILSKKPLGIS